MNLRVDSVKIRRVWTGVLIVAVLVIGSIFLFSAPGNFPVGERIEVGEGLSVHEISVFLHDKKVIRNPIAFNIYLRLSGESKSLNAGSYIFEDRLSLFAIARRIVDGVHNIPLVKLLVLEGYTTEDIAEHAEKVLIDFDKEKFIDIAKSSEGSLFPDTYHLSDDTSEKELLKILQENFENQVGSIKAEIDASDFTLNEILTLASIIEKEVGKPADRRLVSSVLENRLSVGMPLQVDATLDYVLGKNTYELTYEDLEYDSPYNTYKYAGLPPGPIANPGLDSIIAVLEPSESDYLFYVSDREGNTYFAKTYKEHQLNVDKYF